jgi:hypothetical protein
MHALLVLDPKFRRLRFSITTQKVDYIMSDNNTPTPDNLC